MNFALNKPSFKKSIVSLIVAAFTVFIMDVSSQAQSVPSLPSPGTMLTPSASYSPVIIKGITIFPDNPFQFDFIIDDGDDHLQNGAFEKEAIKLVKYFMVSLTMPEDEMWVNLSPYEGDRMIPEKLGYTEIGQNLLEQDYLLKQLTASMMYPETELGSQFWQTVYKKIEDKYGTTDIPMNTFNKVWIIPDKADVYVEENTVYVVNSHLKVLLEEDYLSLESNIGNTKHGMSDSSKDELKKVSEVSSEAIKDVLIPEVEKEVNTGKTFANLRQIYNSLILAAWYKKNLKDSLLSQAYSDKQKIKGVNTENNDLTQQIYNQYLKAFEKGVYDYIREDIDNVSQEVIPRKYFSGGIDNEGITDKVDEVTIKDPLKIKTSELLDTKTVRVILKAFPQLPEPPSDNAMLGEQYSRNQSEFDWKSEKTGIKNILETIKLHNRYIYSEYQEYLRSDINNFSEERLLSLKNEIYSITTMHFGIWGIGTALDSRSAPYFHGNIITALTKTFAELDLNPYAIKYQFITEEDGIKSVKAALERFKPEIWKKYLAYKSAPEDFGKEALQRLKDQIYDIQKANFDIWGLSAVLKASEYPYFNGSYISAL
ncbi:MAG: hypothetical protein KC618_04375, partial [Candidatus Omnitrophica bacterium]|nr:hypothetical protein [Candidatus Omnitrophota bacterium]